MKFCVFWVVIAMFTSAGAFAQKTAPDEVKYRTKDYVDFTVQTVVGNRSNSRIEYVPVRGKSSFRSLIKMRSNFRPELASSASHLK